MKKIILLLIFFALILCGFYFISSDTPSFNSEMPILQNDSMKNEKHIRLKDIRALKEENPDVYAWLCIPGTHIDYPILQSTDTEDGFYLTHDISKDSNIYGALYTEKWNGREFTGFHTIIYGHNMRDGSMFGSLKKYRDPDYMKKHNMIRIETELHVYYFEIVAAYTHSSEYLPSAYDFLTDKGVQSYCKSIPQMIKESKGNLLEESKIKSPLLTLSTCESGGDNYRYLIQAVLVKKE